MITFFIYGAVSFSLYNSTIASSRASFVFRFIIFLSVISSYKHVYNSSSAQKTCSTQATGFNQQLYEYILNHCENTIICVRLRISAILYEKFCKIIHISHFDTLLKIIIFTPKLKWPKKPNIILSTPNASYILYSSITSSSIFKYFLHSFYTNIFIFILSILFQLRNKLIVQIVLSILFDIILSQ